MLSLGEQQWTLSAGTDTITIGRASNADIRLQADDQISRIHARLNRDGATWILHDESRNGTGLNGRRITAPTPLTTGDRIHIGRSILTFHKSTTQTPPTLPEADVPQPSDAQHRPTTNPPAPLPTPTPFPAASTPEPPPAASTPGALDTPPAASQLPQPDQADASPFAQTDQAPGTSPTAPPARAEASPFTPPNQPAADSNPFTQPEHAPASSPFTQAQQTASTNPFASSEQVSGSGSPFASGEQESAGGPVAHGGQPPAGGNPFADGEQVSGSGGPVGAEAGGYGDAAGADGYGAGVGGSGRGANAGGYGAGADVDEYGAGARTDGPGGYEGGGYGAAGVVPGFEVGDEAGRDGGTWAAYPSADNPEPVRSPWEISAQIDQSEPNWNASAGWPDPTAAGTDRRTSADPRARADQRAGGDRRAGADQRTGGQWTGADQRVGGQWAGADQGAGGEEWAGGEERVGGVRAVGRERRTAGGERRGSDADRLSGADDRLPGAERRTGGGDDAVGTVRLSRVLIAAGAVIVLGIVVNLVVTFLADGPGGMLRWLVAPGIALVVAMVLALADAALPKDHRPGRLNVSVLVAVAVVLVGVGVGGFVLTAGAEYVGGYLTGNETGEDRLIKPVTKPGTGVTMTVENVTYTSHFTRVEVKLVNTAKQAITVPIDGTTFTAADGTALRADPGRSAWPSRIASGGTEHGTLTFKGHLPDSATAAVLTFKSGSTTFAISKIALSN